MASGSGSKTETVYNPATGETLGELPHASIADLDEALAASDKAFQVWRKETALNRQKILKKLAVFWKIALMKWPGI